MTAAASTARARGPQVRIVTPAPPGSIGGNRITAERWRGLLEELGCQVVVEESLGAADGDLLVVLHARRGHAALSRWAAERPDAPSVVALTGTDAYIDLPAGDRDALRSIQLASRLVALQPLVTAALPPGARGKLRVIQQSCEVPAELPAPPAEAARPGPFTVTVLAHLRAIKDPLAAAEAERLVARGLPVRILHAGAELDPELARQARDHDRAGGRYRWLGPLPRLEALALLAASDLLCLTSLAEGGANVVTEALALGIPVLTSRIDGSLGLLGADYPGTFEPGDRAGLARALERAVRDRGFLDELSSRCRALAPLAAPARERARWREVLLELDLAVAGPAATPAGGR